MRYCTMLRPLKRKLVRAFRPASVQHLEGPRYVVVEVGTGQHW